MASQVVPLETSGICQRNEPLLPVKAIGGLPRQFCVMWQNRRCAPSQDAGHDDHGRLRRLERTQAATIGNAERRLILRAGTGCGFEQSRHVVHGKDVRQLDQMHPVYWAPFVVIGEGGQ